MLNAEYNFREEISYFPTLFGQGTEFTQSVAILTLTRILRI